MRIDYIRRIFATANLLTRKWEVIVNRTHDNDDLTLKQLLLLIVISKKFDNPPAIKEVSTALATSHQNVKAIALQLKKKGFIKLVTDEKDRRIQRIQILDTKTEYWVNRDRKDLDTMNKLFEGIDDASLITACHVIEKLDENAKRHLIF